MTREKIYVNEYQIYIPLELESIIKAKAKREGMAIRLAAGKLFELIIAGERNKRRAYDGIRYMAKMEKKGKGRKLPYEKSKYATMFLLTFEDTDFVFKMCRDDMTLTNRTIKEIIISWFFNDQWKMEVLDEWL